VSEPSIGDRCASRDDEFNRPVVHGLRDRRTQQDGSRCRCRGQPGRLRLGRTRRRSA
jgi:hypothetical protein